MPIANYKRTVTVAMTGASGAVYGLRLVKQLAENNCRIFLMLSNAAKIVLETEEGMSLPARPKAIEAFFQARINARDGQLTYFAQDDWSSPVASGSGAPCEMVVCPCTTGTLSAIANGASDNLLERAADVVIKEKGKLILVLREMPLSTIHIRNMLSLSETGVTILPASPSFYSKPKTVEQLVDSVVARVLDHVGIEHRIAPRWGV